MAAISSWPSLTRRGVVPRSRMASRQWSESAFGAKNERLLQQPPLPPGEGRGEGALGT